VPPLPGSRDKARGLPGLIGRILAGLVAIAMLVLGFMFSLAVFAVAFVVAVIVFGWLWWKLRRAMRQMREDPRFRKPPGQGDVIEGEVLRGEWRDGKSE